LKKGSYVVPNGKFICSGEKWISHMINGIYQVQINPFIPIVQILIWASEALAL